MSGQAQLGNIVGRYILENFDPNSDMENIQMMFHQIRIESQEDKDKNKGHLDSFWIKILNDSIEIQNFIYQLYEKDKMNMLMLLSKVTSEGNTRRKLKYQKLNRFYTFKKIKKNTIFSGDIN
eukprot:TRINITY_DN1257_c0_g6_i1.p1 TRINITY_DN1257_c0_g6~~TRINITY_DN1257_c0_g6_i1.p1  ORF type:complete len:122 (-),score=12.36 TRINITY_DN1257_c0_g6_i1:91-456(-)